MALGDIHSELSDQRVSSRKLRNGESGNRELADADDADAELRQADNVTGKLADGDDSFRDDGHPVSAILERNVNQWQARDGRARLVLPSVAVPRRASRERSPAVGTGKSLIRNLVLALPARSQHVFGRSPTNETRPVLPLVWPKLDCDAVAKERRVV